MTYTQLKQKFLEENPTCVVTGRPSIEPHHKQGKLGKLMNYVPLWIPVSREGHDIIHRKPDYARTQGWLCKKGLWNAQVGIDGKPL